MQLNFKPLLVFSLLFSFFLLSACNAPAEVSEPEPEEKTISSLKPVDNGEPIVAATNGRIGVVCIGMSNAKQECGHYMDTLYESLSDQINPEVVVVNCAVGGRAIERWNDPEYDEALWDTCLNEMIPEAGLDPEQIKVVWHKAAKQFVTEGDRKGTLIDFQTELSSFAEKLLEKLPSVQAVYTTSRSYGGFTDRYDRGEPLSRAQGQALNNWLKKNPKVGGVWFGWGPYIWGPECSGNDEGLCYEREDYADDGIHPALGAREKISKLLHERFLMHDWYKR